MHSSLELLIVFIFGLLFIPVMKAAYLLFTKSETFPDEAILEAPQKLTKTQLNDFGYALEDGTLVLVDMAKALDSRRDTIESLNELAVPIYCPLENENNKPKK